VPSTPTAAGGAPAKSFLVGIVLVGALIGLWILASPSGAGPDEPSHLVRSAGLVRGQVRGEPIDEIPASRLYEVPAWIAAENPDCYAHDQLQPASCIVGVDVPDGDAELPSRSREYPIWGHLLPGAATFLPASAGPWMARVLHGLIPALLVGVALTERARRGWLAAGSTLLAITPMAWFLFAVVNPSGLVIAGGLSLWVGLLGARDAAGTDPPIDAQQPGEPHADVCDVRRMAQHLDDRANDLVRGRRATNPHACLVHDVLESVVEDSQSCMRSPDVEAGRTHLRAHV